MSSESMIAVNSRAIFISHSNEDKELVVALTELLKAAFRLPAKEILCTSVSGHKLPGGADTEEELLQILQEARILIGVLTPFSLGSSYVLFELGARWGLKKPLVALTANGTKMGDIKEPLKSKNALNAADQEDVHQLIEDVANYLGQSTEPPSAYNSKVRQLVNAAKSRSTSVPKSTRSKVEPERKLLWFRLIREMKLELTGPPDCRDSFYRAAKRGGLKPIGEHPDNWTHRIAAAGVTLEDVTNFSDLDADRGQRKFQMSLAPQLIHKTASVIDRWLQLNKGIDGGDAEIKFHPDVWLETELHKITSNIFESDLSMLDEGIFEFRGIHCFSLGHVRGEPSFLMARWKKMQLSEVPWEDLFTALVRKRIILMDKSLAKSVWEQ